MLIWGNITQVKRANTKNTTNLTVKSSNNIIVKNRRVIVKNGKIQTNINIINHTNTNILPHIINIIVIIVKVSRITEKTCKKNLTKTTLIKVRRYKTIKITNL